MHRVLQELVRDAARSDGFGRRLAARVQTRCSLLRDNGFDPKGRWEIEPLRALSAQMLARKDEAAPWLANQTVEVLRVLGRYWEAEPLSREALEQLRQALPAGHRDIATSLNNLAGLLRAQGKLSEAEPLYRDALELRRRALPAGHPDIAQSLNNLAVLLGAQGKVSEAEPLAREALELRRRALPAGHPDIAQSLNSLAVVLQAQGKLSEAEPLFREALQLSRQALPAGHPDIAPSLTGLRSLAFACHLKEDHRGPERVLG